MKCYRCSSDVRPYGHDRKGRNRYHCDACRYTFTERQPKSLDGRRLSIDKAVECLHHLVEGVSIRSTERLTGVDKKTILSLLVKAGDRCESLMEKRICQVKVAQVQADEIWGFVWCKEKTKKRLGREDDGLGDAWTFVAFERRSKLVLAYHLGRRTSEDTEAFTEKIDRATAGHFQISTDGFEAYPEAISLSLGVRVDFAQVIKTYGAAHPGQSPEGERRYSPSRVLEITKTTRIGEPDLAQTSTSHVERQNLTMRMMMRRLTRLTNAFSKKWENLKAALALHFAFYNFCRIHSKLRCTPAMEAGITKHIWELQDLLTKRK